MQNLVVANMKNLTKILRLMYSFNRAYHYAKIAQTRNIEPVRNGGFCYSSRQVEVGVAHSPKPVAIKPPPGGVFI